MYCEEDIDDIAKQLENEYPDEEICSLTLEEIKDLIRSLDEFNYYDTEVSNELLNEISEKWQEKRNNSNYENIL